MPKPRKIVRVDRAQARAYVGKAEQFLASAEAAQGLHDAMLLGAIHAGISACDAVCVALAGQRSTDPDHHGAVSLLEEVAAGSGSINERARQLRALLAKKNRVEYESRRATAREAVDGLQQAKRLVAWAREEIARARI